MVVIHIAGTSGSGKSWLGMLMKRIYPDKKLHVVDLDDIFKREIDRTVGIKEVEDRYHAIETHVLDKINKLKHMHSNLLITGYSDFVIDNKVRYVELGAERKYFIDIPIDQLIQQYRSRAGHHIMHTRHAASTLSNDSIRKMVATDKKIYRSFKHMKQMLIVKEIILLIGN